MGITKEGIEGEHKLFRFLWQKGFEAFQPDAIGYKENEPSEYFVFEAKHQARYTPPPFVGHGLPIKQVQARLRFQKQTGVIAVLVIFDKETKEVFYQRLDKLEKTEFYDTKGSKPRRVYNLKYFKKANEQIQKVSNRIE